MAIEIKSSKEKIDTIVRNVNDYSVLIDDVSDKKTVTGLDCMPGLGMRTEAKSFRGLTQDLSDGVFKTLVMGKFKNGKSSLINGLTGRLMMAANATATTAVIAVVMYGEKENQVQIYRNDSPKPQIISLDQFTREYALSEDDQKLIENGGNFDRFADVDYVVMESKDPLFRDGVRLIDSPGLEEANSRTKTALRFVPKANAIIYVINALSLFSGQERRYIADNFFGKNLRNVFFVVNRIDQLQPGQLDSAVKPSVRSYLEPVFLDQSGRFDQELYDKRVFYTNAYGALCARTNQPYCMVIGRKQIEVPVEIGDTGMPEFEAALSEFLNSDERIHATFQSTLVSMANVYRDACNKVEEEKKARSLPLAQLEENAKLSSKVLEDLRAQANDMQRTVIKAGDLIGQKVYMNLVSYVQTDIPREFAADIENDKVDFGIGSMLRLAGVMLQGVLPRQDKQKLADKQEEIMKPLITKVNQYIKGKIEDWASKVPTLIAADISDLSEELNEEVGQFDLGLEKSMQLFSTGNVKVDQGKKANPLQTVLALANWDISLAVEGAADGGMKWGEFLKRVMTQIALDLGVTIVFGAPLLIPALIIEIVSLSYRANKLPKQIMGQIGPKAFEELMKNVQKNERSFKESINMQFNDQSKAITAGALSLVDDAQRKQTAILEQKRKMSENVANEDHRQEQVLKALYERFGAVYNTLFGHKPSESELAGLAAKKK